MAATATSELLASCYHRSLALALEHDVRSIAFPSISTGAYGYPRQDAAEIAVSTMRDYETRFEEIIACCFSDDDLALYQQVLSVGRG